MTAAALPISTSKTRAPGFFSQVRAEWTKLSSQRAFYIQMGLALLLAIGLSALICLAVASSWDKETASQRADFHPVLTSLVGMAFSTIVLTVTGVTLVSSEYTSGMVRLTMTVTPNRLRVLFAKILVIALVTWAIGLFAVFGSFFAGQAVLGTHSGVPTSSLSNGDAQRGVLAAWATVPLFPLIGAALGAILRSTASAITATLALIFVPGIFGGLLPEWWQEHLMAYLPGSAREVLMRSDHNYVMYLSPGVAAAAVIAWLVFFFGLAAVLIKRRDV
jgi:ABC-2 type transport system permease protein